MAVAITTSPAAVVANGSNVSSLTTAAFTPPSGSLLLMVAILDQNSPADMGTPSTVTGSTSAWNTVIQFNNYDNNNSGGTVVIAWASVTSSVSTTTRVSWSGSSDCAMKTYVLTGANTSNPVVGQSGSFTYASNPTNVSYTATVAGSLSFWAYEDYNDGGAPSLTNSTSDATLSTWSRGALWHQTTASSGATTQSFSISGTGSSNRPALAFVEILPSSTVQGGGTGSGGTGGSTLLPHTYQFKLNGVDITQYLEQGTWQVSQDWGRQGDTASFHLVDDHTGTPTVGNVTPQATQTVSFVDTTLGITLFGGVVSSPDWQYLGYGTDYWTLNCVSYATWADSRIVSYSYQNSSMGYIIANLTANASAGITTSNVVTGPTITSVSGQFEPLSKAWSKITQMASTNTTYGWWVDGNANLWVADEAQAQASGITFTDVPTTSHANAEGHYDTTSQFKYTWDASSLANRIYTVGGNVSATQTDAWTSNANRRSYALTYPLDSSGGSQPILKVNGAATVVSTTATDPWYLLQDSSTGLWTLNTGNSTTTPTPPNGQPISLTYSYAITQVSIVQNTTSQALFASGSNGGYFDATVSDQNLTTLAATQQRGKHEAAEYAFPQERVTFQTTEDWQGWASVGQLCTFKSALIPDSANSYNRGINKTFLIISLRVQGSQAYRTCQFTCVRVS